ncbi:hypothetical protein HXX76_006962 [Chlamydomonas incerta]|uniref:Uncharacterized protein n=1 Tax=Chlamydomonas incerta TaxID=51695 RepID=A0A835T1T0_CHLIN|nr:hypothetical protein HXX76_006962 [Chlamydomonas incerta]|eukprot:KAG2435766.1 hypothetical protein HXX76_006962 [Chlamydomonas incerta]
MGIRQDMPITLIGYPLAADDKPVRGFERPLTPLVAQGKVAWLTDDAEEAVGTYAGALPNSSGGAVALGPPYYFLAGLHVGAFWHEAGQRRQDATAAEDQGRPTVGPPGAGGARAACAVVMETDTWSSAAVGGLAARAACGRTSKHQQELKGGSSSANPSKPVRRPGAQQQPQVDEVARDQVLQQCLEDVEYCVANVEHKGQMAVFVPAAMLARLLKCCPGA